MDNEELAKFRIHGLPDTMYYLPNFISCEEERHILDSLPSNRWINLSRRRLQAHPSVLAKSNTLLAAPLPEWLDKPITSRLHNLGIFLDSPHRGPNHVLVNEYHAGEGIMPHEDGGAYHPIVATISLGGSTVLDVYDKPVSNPSNEDRHRTQPELKSRILQEPRSLLVTTGEAYTDLLHGILEVEVDTDLTADTVANWHLLADTQRIVDDDGVNVRATRISLTYRDVLRDSKFGTRMFGKRRA